MRAPAVDGKLMGEALAIAGQRADRLDASFDLNAAGSFALNGWCRRTGGRLTANGQHDTRTGAMTALATATDLAVNPVPDTEPGQVLCRSPGSSMANSN